MRIHRLVLATGLAVLALSLSGCGGLYQALGITTVNLTSQHTFDPQASTAVNGTTMYFTNVDTVPHSVTPDTAAGPNSDIAYPNGIPAGSTYSYTVPTVASGTTYFFHDRFFGSAGTGHAYGSGMAGSITIQ